MEALTTKGHSDFRDTQFPSDYFCHLSYGTLLFDPGKNSKQYRPNWALLNCDRGIIKFYQWLLLKHGVRSELGSFWDAHISVVKGEEPPNKDVWGRDEGLSIPFYYTNQIGYNDEYAWLDVWSPTLACLRLELGFETIKMSFHLTIGRCCERNQG